MEPRAHHFSTKHLALFLLLLIVILLALGVGGFYLYSKQKSSSGTSYNTTTNTPTDALMQSNLYFVQAESAESAGNYTQAKTLFDEALSSVTDSYQKGQIEYDLANLEGKYGSPVEAVDLYKQIVSDSEFDNYKQVKAYAVSSMAELFYQNGSSTITQEIFKNPPYTALYVGGNSGLAYRHLDEYATSFYPLATPELRIADWYAFHIRDATSTDGVATSTYPAIIAADLKLANANIDAIKTDPNAASSVPSILVRRSSLYITLYNDGLVSAQDAETACQDAVNIYASTGQSQFDGYARYYYGVLLSELGASRASDLQKDLAPFYTTTQYQNSAAVSFFQSEKNNYLGQKQRLVAMAQLDPKFKTFLISLGWNGSDF